MGNFLRIVDLKKTFSKGDTTDWSYKLCKVTENIKVTIPSFRIGFWPERYIEALLKKTNLTMIEKKDVQRKKT